MIIDNQLEGLTYDITANLFDIYLDENNNSFSNIDSLSTTESISKSLSKLIELPKSILTFKKMPSIKFEEQKEDNLINKMEINKQKLNSIKNHQLTKQSVKRALFVDKDEIDHDANLKLVNKQMEQLEKQDCEKWNFDFKNNRPLNKSNSQYEWFKNDSILSNSNNLNKLDTNNNLMINKSVKLNLTFDDNCKNDNNERISSSSKYEILLRNNTISNNTRSVKRKLNLDDYFQQSKKRQITSQKDQAKASSDQNLSPVKYSFTDIKRSTKITEAKSIKFQKPTTSKQTINKQIEKRKTRNQRKQKQLDKKQTTLKF